MRIIILSLSIITCLLTGCDSDEMKAEKQRKHLASLTCQSSKEGRTKDELQAIASACFRRGSYGKSSGIKW
tara:strand:+ start:232 stop:444 length:213 start_codon:yes stop_codon:yes gene_type:complete